MIASDKLFLSTAGIALSVAMLVPSTAAQAENCIMDRLGAEVEVNDGGAESDGPDADDSFDDDNLACGVNAEATGEQSAEGDQGTRHRGSNGRGGVLHCCAVF